MQKLRIIAVGVVLLAALFAVPVAQALPQGAVYNSYYDANWNQIGEKDILCDGYHDTWGVTTGAAHQTGYTEPCGGGNGTWHCYYWDNACGCYVEDDLAHCGL
jgi:hypothetical protein